MKKLLYISVIALAGITFILTGCDRDYDAPDVNKLWTDTDVAAEGYTIVPISTIKQLYYDKFGQNVISEAVEIEDYYAVKGTVVSDDRQGNVYRSIYIQDASGGIEVKIGSTANYTVYGPGETVYVLCRNLTLGNYRYNLSIGYEAPTSEYANGYLDTKTLIEHHIKVGSRGKSLTSADTLVVTSPDQLNDNMIGRLIRIEGAVSRWGTWSGDSYPSFLEAVRTIYDDTQYTNYSFSTVIEDWRQYYQDHAIWEVTGIGTEPKKPISPEPGALYESYAFRNGDIRYYGSAWFQFGEASESDPTHNLIVRTSGHADFALNPLPADGTRVNITALYTKYSSSSGGYIKYQLTLNNLRDVEVIE